MEAMLSDGSLSPAEAQAKLLMAHRYVQPIEREWREFDAIDRARELADFLQLELIEALDALGWSDPSSNFIVGHRVGLRMKAGLEAEALEVARDCRALEWWCAELTGFVHHVMGDFAAADSAFRHSYERMPEWERCGDQGVENIRGMLQGEPLREYRRLECEDRKALESRFWWLADPLHLMPVNDRHTEHRARVVGLRLHDQQLPGRARPPFGCTDSHWDAVAARGWPDHWWSPERPSSSGRDLPGVALAPGQAAMESPLEIQPDDWELDPGAVRERYDLPYGPLHALPHQVAFFRRGDSASVVAATDLSRHPLSLSGAREVGVVLSRGPDDVPVRATTGEVSSEYRFRVNTPAERYLVSVEALAEAGGAGRARFGAGLMELTPGGVGISNLLFFDWAATQEETLDAVYPHMLGTTELPGEAVVGVFWEVYGVEAAETLSVVLRVVPESTGFLRRLGRALRVVGPAEGVRLTWEASVDTVNDQAVLSTSLGVDLRTLEPDAYRLELTVERDGESLTETRRFSVR